MQFCAILLWVVDGGDVTVPRQPGWMRLQTRPFVVGANLPKHWRDGQSLISFDVKASEVLWVPRNRLNFRSLFTFAKTVQGYLAQYDG